MNKNFISYLFLSLFSLAVDEQCDVSSTALAFLPSVMGAPLHLSTVTRTSCKKQSHYLQGSLIQERCILFNHFFIPNGKL